MRYTITSYKGFDKMAFGDQRTAVRSQLGEYKEFRKTPLSKNTTDDFGDFHVYYDQDNKVEAVEFFDSEIYVGGEKIPKDVGALPASFADDGSGGFISDDLGISVYAPNGAIETVLIFAKGYWD
jgi:hypothetical protein